MNNLLTKKERVLLGILLTVLVLGMLVVLVLLILTVAEAKMTAPDGNNWLDCLKTCCDEYEGCYRKCNPMNDQCWYNCLSIFNGCLGGCGMSPRQLM